MSIHAKCFKVADLVYTDESRTMLVCSRSKGHTGKCRDVDHDVWFVANKDVKIEDA